MLWHTLFGVWRYVVVTSWLPNTIQVLGIPSMLLATIYAWRKHNCRQPWCWRISKHIVRGTTYATCSRHATLEVHAALVERHKAERPEQHLLLGGPEEEAK